MALLLHPGAEVKHATISAASSGDNTVVAAVSGKRILVLQVKLIADSAVDARFEDGAGGTELAGPAKLGTSSDSGGYVLNFSPVGWFKTSANTLLNLELSAAVQVSGVIAYQEI